MLYTYTLEPREDNTIGEPITLGELSAEDFNSLCEEIRETIHNTLLPIPSDTYSFFSSNDGYTVYASYANLRVGCYKAYSDTSDTLYDTIVINAPSNQVLDAAIDAAWGSAELKAANKRYGGVVLDVARGIIEKINSCLRNKSSAASNLSKVYGLAALYNWSAAPGPGVSYGFTTGTYIRWGRGSSSFGNVLTGYGTGTGYYGAMGIPYFPARINYENIMGTLINSRILLRATGDPETSLNLCKNYGRFFTVKIGYASLSVNSNGDITGFDGLHYELVSAPAGNNKNLFTADTDLSKIETKEFVADVDNTYPGGGEDKNTYPEDDESGKGTFDNTNDPIDFPAMPIFDATSTGFISMWNPNIVEITDLYGFLWDSDISTTIKKLFIEPMDAIISLSFFPVDPTIDSRRNVTIAHVDTEIEMNHVQKQFVDFDFGSITLDEYYGAAWDYSPYTKASIYLPYIGVHEINIDDVMNATLTLKYRIDLLSGMCAAMLKVVRSRDGLDAVIYTWQGNCAMQVPVSAGSARDFLNSIIQLGAMAGVSIAQPFAGSLDAAMHKGDENYESSIMGNNWINPTIATFSALNVIGQKVHVQRGGRVDANAGVMSPQSAYIILNRPVSAIPRGWNNFAGYPSLKIKSLSTQSGYTEVAYIKLNGLEATSEEIMELDGILKGGVIL